MVIDDARHLIQQKSCCAKGWSTCFEDDNLKCCRHNRQDLHSSSSGRGSSAQEAVELQDTDTEQGQIQTS